MNNIKIFAVLVLTFFMTVSLFSNQKEYVKKMDLRFSQESNYLASKYSQVKTEWKNLTKDQQILLRNSILFSALSCVPFLAGSGLVGALIIYPILDNIIRKDLPSDKLVTEREVPGIVIGAVFGSMMYAMFIYFIVLGVINGIKYSKSLKEKDTQVTMLCEQDPDDLTMRTGIRIKF